MTAALDTLGCIFGMACAGFTLWFLAVVTGGVNVV